MTTLEGFLSQIPPTGVSPTVRADRIITAKQKMDQFDPSRKAASDPYMTVVEKYTPPTSSKPKTAIPGKDATLKTFSLAVAHLTAAGWSQDSRYTPAKIELAPARSSFFDRQGQRVPGADAGMVHSVSANLVKLHVPASRPIYQQLGIRDELLEWVGAFIGHDGELKTEQGTPRAFNAWAEYMDVKGIFTAGREILINMVWAYGYSSENTSAVYRGVIKELDIAYATEQRIYYKVCVQLTNREDLSLGGGRGYTSGTKLHMPKDIQGSDSIRNSFLKAQVLQQKIAAAEATLKLAKAAEALSEAASAYSVDPVIPRTVPLPQPAPAPKTITIDGQTGVIQ